MNWLHYLLEANLYLGMCYLVYYLFLSSQTWYSLNRAYLLISSVIAFIIPFIQLGFLKPVETLHPIGMVLIPSAQVAAIPAMGNTPAAPEFTWQDGLVDLYFAGAAVLLIIFLVKITQLVKLMRTNVANEDPGYKLVYIAESNTAFSFFNFLFIGTNTEKTATIIRHELVHITQKHSVDIVFIELLKIVNWFNPFVYLVQHSLKAVHEYIADEQTAMAENDALAYCTFLVNNAYGISGSSVTHSFFNYKLLKNRIIMLNQQRSGNLARLKYLLFMPLCAGMLCASTLAFSKTYGIVDIAPRTKTDTPKRVHFTAKNDVVRYNNAYTTTKGYKINEYVDNNNGAVTKKVIITDKDGSKHTYYEGYISVGDRKMLSDKYGYKFPNERLTELKLLPPPAPPAPPKSGKNVKLLPPTVHQLATPTVNKFPPPTLHQLETVTKTGYKFKEDGYIVNGKTDFRVIIIENNGDQNEYFKSKATTADLKLLKDKYGYTFPIMEIYTKLPPPPPTPPVDNQPPPPPPAPPVKKAAALKYVIKADNANGLAEDYTPVILIDGKEYDLKEPLKKGQTLLIDAVGGEHAVVYTDNDLRQAIEKYGERAKNGVIFASGKTIVSVRQD